MSFESEEDCSEPLLVSIRIAFFFRIDLTGVFERLPQWSGECSLDDAVVVVVVLVVVLVDRSSRDGGDFLVHRGDEGTELLSWSALMVGCCCCCCGCSLPPPPDNSSPQANTLGNESIDEDELEGESEAERF